MREQFMRTQMLIGQDGLNRLLKAHVLVFGIGGVGSAAAEALVRSGIGHITVVDSDTVDITNLNRQVLATHSTLGLKKTEAMRRRLLDISPHCEVTAFCHFYLPGQEGGIFDFCYDYIIDAIDTVSAKIDLVMKARQLSIPIISSMGTGNKFDPSRLAVADIYQTHTCPLCRVMRAELRKRGIESLKVVFSDEEPVKPVFVQQSEEPPMARRSTPGSTAFVPPAAGLLMASEVVRSLAFG